ncbi:MAG: Clp protease N-terminal domain-containing protein [Planctomycetota bacterium]
MSLSRLEALRLDHGYIGTEHLLLGLLAEGTGVAANVLKNMKVDLEQARIEVTTQVKAGPSKITMGQLPFTPQAKKVLELSLAEASELSHNYIGTEHLLLGMIRENQGIAARVLTNLGVELDAVRDEVLDFIGEGEERGGELHFTRSSAIEALAKRATFSRERQLFGAIEPDRHLTVVRGQAFVMLPPGDPFADLYHQVIVPALNDAGLDRVQESNDLRAAEADLLQVWEHILSSEILLAVVTSQDPGVLHQVGLCHGTGRGVILLGKSEDLPAHLRSLPLIGNDAGGEGRTNLKSQLTAAARKWLELVRHPEA